MKKLFVLFIVLCSSLCLVACKNKINAIKINEDSVPEIININELDSELAKIKLEVISDNNEINLVSFERSMFQDSDYNKLKNPGTHTIEISYEGFKTTLTIIVEDPNAYSVKVVYPNGNPVEGGVTVQWCTGSTCLLPVAVDSQGTAYNSIDDAEYYIHIDGIPAGYTYDPNAYTANKNNKKVTIDLISVNSTTGEGTINNPIVVSEGAKPKDGNVVIKKIVADSADTIRLGGIGDQLASQLEVLLGGKEVRATNIGHTQRGGETCQYDRSLCTKLGSLAVDALFEGKSGEMVTIYNAVPQTVSLEKVLGSGATGETSKGGSHNVDPNGFVVRVARNTGISFGD